MTKWQVLDLLEFDGYVGNDRGVLLVNEVRVPVADLSVVLLGQKVRWGYGLVDKASRFDFSVLVCDWRNVPIAYLGHWSENTRVVARHRAQASLTEPRRKNAWKQIVRTKVWNQGAVLDTFGRDHSALLKNLSKKVVSGDPTNIEAQAAAVYFQALFGKEFRRDQSSRDSINGALNYGYTLLRGVVVREVTAAGLSPSLGIFHHGRSNTFALCDDLIEIFRPFVDYGIALHVEQSSELTPENKRAVAGLLREPFGEEGASLQTSIRSFCQSYAQYVEGESARLKPPAWVPRSQDG